MSESVVIAVRLGVLAALYLFLFAVIRIVWRDVVRAAPAGHGAIGRATLIVVQPGQARLKAGQRLPLEAAAGVGRDSDNQVPVEDGTVSGRHCALYFREGVWWVEDLGSTNGTWINDRRVQAPAVIHAGDLLQVGRVSFRFSD